MEGFDWCEELRKLIAAADALENAVRMSESWARETGVASDILPRDVPDPHHRKLPSTTVAVRERRRLAAELFEELCTRPAASFLGGSRLSRQQYYLLRALGAEFGTAHALGISPCDDFECFENLYYSDDFWKGYINPTERPGDPAVRTVGMRFGRPPEELSRRALRPEQQKILASYLPDVMARFAE